MLVFQLVLYGVLISNLAYTEGSAEVTIQPHPSKVKEGESYTLICQTRVEISDIINTELRWSRKSGEVLSDGNGAVNGNYSIAAEYNRDEVMTSNLTILKIAPRNDGEYICQKRLKMSGKFQNMGQDETNLVVLQDVTELTLTVGSTIVTGEDKNLTINIPAIGQSVKCKAKGSNPKPMLHIYMDGKDMQKDWKLQDISNFNQVPSGEKEGVRSHTTELVAEEGTLLRKSDESKLIRCTAEVPGSDFPQKAVEAHITVAYDPEFDCKNRTAIVNDRYVKLECHIKAYPPIKGHLWKDADMKITSADNNGTVEYTQTHTSDGEEFHTTLTIERVLKRHFNTTFFLEVITEDNKKHTHPLRLIEKHWTSAASRPYLTLLMYSSVTILTMLSHW